MRKNPKQAFTLIELLVVIAIIAMLLAVVMPALQKVKRQARLVICSTNLRSYAMGFAVSAENNNGKYIKRKTPAPTLLYVPSQDTPPDYPECFSLLESLYLAIDGDAGPDAFCCPLAPKDFFPTGVPGYFESRNQTNLKFNDVWTVRVDAGGVPLPAPWYYSQTYNIFAGMEYVNMDWSYSGNGSKNEGPIMAGSSMQVVVADRVDFYNRGSNSTWYALHNQKGNQSGRFTQTTPSIDEPFPEVFIDAQAGYADGHVERTKKKEGLHWVSYSTSNYYLY